MRKLNNVNEEIYGAAKIWKKVDGKRAFILEDPPDAFIEALKFADTDVFLNIREFLILEATCPLHQP